MVGSSNAKRRERADLVSSGTRGKVRRMCVNSDARRLHFRSFIVQRMADNDKIVTRYMDDKEFGDAAFTVLSKAIYDAIPGEDRT
jgi:hypothetical protein